MRRTKGFTLVELMIAVAIVGILAAVAIPSYQNYVLKANRAEAKSMLMDAASRQEQYYMDNRTYTLDMDKLGYTVDAGGKVDTGTGKYLMDATVADASSYTLAATAQGNQVSDSCGTFTLDSIGNKTPIAAGCW